MLLVVLWIMENVKDECPCLVELSVLVHFQRLHLEMRVDSFPESTKSLAASYQCNSFTPREKFICSNHRRTVCECATLFFHYFSCCLQTRTDGSKGLLVLEAIGCEILPYFDPCDNDGDLAALTKRDHRAVLISQKDERRADTEE